MYMSCELLNGEYNGLSCKACMYVATHICMNSYAWIHINSTMNVVNLSTIGTYVYYEQS